MPYEAIDYNDPCAILMSIETKLARAMSELNERGVLVLQDPEVDTTRIARAEGGGWSITAEYGDGVYRTRLVSRRDELEDEIRSWLKCQEQLDSF